MIKNIEFIIRKPQADIVITHSLNDTHHDHSTVAASTLEAGETPACDIKLGRNNTYTSGKLTATSGNVYFGENNPNKIDRLVPGTETFTE